MKKERIEWVDISKGIGIIIVLFAHIIINNMYISKFIEAFVMPLFFIISGFLNYICNKNKTNYNKILIPYFIFAILTFTYWAIIERHIRHQNNSIIWQGINIFYGAGGKNNYLFNITLWFIPCYLTTEFIFNYIKKFKRERLCIILFIFSILGFIFPKIFNFRLPLSIDTSFTTVVFYGIGYLLGSKYNNIKEILNKKNHYFICFTIIFICFMITYNFNTTPDINNLIFGNYFLFYISGITGSLSLMLLSYKIKSKALTWIGKNTLIIMYTHEPIKRVLLVIIAKLLNLNVNIIRENIIFSLLNTILLTIVLIPVIIITNKILKIIESKINRKIKLEEKNESSIST